MFTTVDVINRIKGQLYLGNSSAAKNFSLLKTHEITHILICCSEIGPAYPDKFNYKKLNITETFDFNILRCFPEAFQFIDEALASGGGVFVHCVQGQSRSPSIVISYLMKKYNKTYKQALKHVKKRHRITQPNLGFVEQLTEYEKSLSENNPKALTCSVCNC